MKAKTKGKQVMIGDYLGTIEEYVPGAGTYAEDGKIFAARIGEKTLDKKGHKVKVKGEKPLDLEVGQVVFGEVSGMRRKSVRVTVKKVRGFKEEIGIRMTLYISNISDDYVEKPEDLFGIGDIVKGKIIKMDEGLKDISTQDSDLGVVKAFCKRCRHPLVKPKGKKFKGKLVCENCGHKEKRKIAQDYGKVSEI